MRETFSARIFAMRLTIVLRLIMGRQCRFPIIELNFDPYRVVVVLTDFYLLKFDPAGVVSHPVASETARMRSPRPSPSAHKRLPFSSR